MLLRLKIGVKQVQNLNTFPAKPCELIVRPPFFFRFSRVIISGLYFDIKIRWKRMEKVTEASNDEF